ncbi:unnamed protein product [Chrysoparadoxa australica]
MMKNGEEAAIVIDIGSASAKVGFSGEDIPRVVFPSVLEGLDLPPEERAALRTRRPQCKECYSDYGTVQDTEGQRLGPVQRGELCDPDEMEKLLDSVFSSELGVYPDVHQQSVMMVEPPLRMKATRAEQAEMMFETFKVPGIAWANSSVLSLFASGRTRGLVVECGAGVSHVVPVFEGFALNHAILRLELAGQDLTIELRKQLEARGLEGLSWNMVRDCKETLGVVQPDAATCDAGVEEYELPDGSSVKVDGKLRSQLAEQLFNPKGPQAARCTNGGLPEMAMASIDMCDKNLQHNLLENIVVAGGTTMMPGFCERLKVDVGKLLPEGSTDCCVIPHPTVHEAGYYNQRKHAPWIGGSMVASLPTFKHIQVTKQEYDEVGVDGVHQRCL